MIERNRSAILLHSSDSLPNKPLSSHKSGRYYPVRWRSPRNDVLPLSGAPGTYATRVTHGNVSDQNANLDGPAEGSEEILRVCDTWRCFRAAFIHVNIRGRPLPRSPQTKDVGLPRGGRPERLTHTSWTRRPHTHTAWKQPLCSCDS